MLEEVLELDPDRLADLNQLLDRTTLAAIVSAARSITDRLDFLPRCTRSSSSATSRRVSWSARSCIAFWRPRRGCSARSTTSSDDESLTNVLRRHLAYLKRDELAAEKVTDEHGRTRIVDLMLAKSLEHAANRREHLVVELNLDPPRG